jgi:hypothetical protein
MRMRPSLVLVSALASSALVAGAFVACGGGGRAGGSSSTTTMGTGGAGASTSTSTSTSTGAGGGCAPLSCEGQALAALVDRTKVEADLATVAHPRSSGSPGWQSVQDLCADRLTALGYQVERQHYDTGVNVVGTLPGSDEAGEKVIVSAHYDAVPGCDGADDNGSGIAGVLEAARVLAQGSFHRTLVVACWDEEELGLVGSKAYADEAKANGDAIAAAFVFEMIGYKSEAAGSQSLPAGFALIFPEQAAALKANGSKGDFIAVVGDAGIERAQSAYVAAAAKVGLPAVSLALTASQKNDPLFSDLQRSDHASFWANDYPALMLTDTANFRNPHYHCAGGPDAVSDLDGEFSTKVIQAAVWAVVETLQAM